MKMKLFDQIDLGKEEIVVAPVTAKEIDPVEALETIDAFTAIQSIEDEAAVAREAIDIADTVVASLGKQLDVENGVLAKPEDINGTVVAMSIETLKSTALILGVNMDTVNVSAEAIEADPAEALKMSIEAKDDFMKKVIDNIKLLFKKFMALMKKLYTKAVVALSGVAATAEKLKETLDKNKGKAEKDITLDDATLGRIKGLVGALVINFGKGDFTQSFGQEIGAILKDTNSIDAAAVSVTNLAKEIGSAVKDLKDETSAADLTKVLEGIAGKLPVVGIDYKYDGMSYKEMGITIPTVADGDYSKDKAAAIIKSISFKANVVKADEKEFKVKSVKYDDLQNIVGQLIAPAKDAKAFLSKVESKVKDISNSVEKLPEEDVYMPVVKLGNVVVSNMGMDIVIGNINTIKRVLAAVNAVAKVATGGKEDKKEEEK